MYTPQSHETDKMRTDAIQMGIRKARANRPEEAESYFMLAKQHGSTEQDIQQALEQASQIHGQHVSRRNILKILVASAVALGTTGLVAHNASAHVADQFGDFYGTDSGAISQFGMQQDFYIGRLGRGTTADTSAKGLYNNDAATKAGPSRTFAYWSIVGPRSRPSGMTPLDWGTRQAIIVSYALFAAEILGGKNIGGGTIFGAIGAMTPGWGTTPGEQADNRNVVSSFLSTMHASPTPFPGLYISSSRWDKYLGGAHSTMQDITLNTPFVLWLANDQVDPTIVPPSDPRPLTQPSVHASLQKNIKNVTLGGESPILWQYWSDNKIGDYNVAIQDPTANNSSFIPSTIVQAI